MAGEEKKDLTPIRVQEGSLLQPEVVHCMRDGKLDCGAVYSDMDDEQIEYVDASEFLCLAMIRAGVNLCKGCFVEFNKVFNANIEASTYHFLDPDADDKKYLCGRELPEKPLPRGITPCMLCEYEFIVVRNQQPEKLKYGFRSDRWGRRSKGLRSTSGG